MIFLTSAQKDRRVRRYGFTLSEVLVAMVLLTIVTQAIYQFYSIGLRSYRNSQISADMVGSARYLKKLIEEKISFKSNNNFSTFMKKNGFSTISGLNNILVELPEGRNIPLYNALGFSDYLVHQSKNIEECTSETIVKKLAALGHIYNSEFSGNYITEVTKEAGLLNGAALSFSFSPAPVNMLGASFCGPGDFVKISADCNPSLTAEINVSGLSDISNLFSPLPAGPVSIIANVNKRSAYNGRVFDLMASFDTKQAPVFTPGTGMAAPDAKTYFVTGANLFCDDGMLFYEQDINDRFVNHAFYVKT
ncbi:MAG TPA: prepilin-type N-terminal cleavage/methylation domain-containing protein, partial [Candidatus Wallbacteria bacterium]|nr:prepilin-type N-terminal cleavage/methylation domain-containing protein [Candidatus Wallbacteria bacterium]